MKTTIAFVYKWTHIPTGKWYIGSRTKAGCNPNDGYICSSRKIKPMIVENQSDWIRTILCIGHSDDMLALESRYLTTLDAKHDPMSYNMHNGDGKFTTAGKEPWNKGIKRPTGRVAWNRGLNKNNNAAMAKASANLVGRAAPNKGQKMSEEQRLKMIEIHNNRSEETCKKISLANTGKVQTAEANAKRSATQTGRIQSPEHVAKRAAARRAYYAAKKQGPVGP